ncbi:signal peptidase I [Pedobacter sp. WC2501]
MQIISAQCWVPKDSFFVLGDNRNNARDSRYIGFIKKSDLLGVVL